MLAFGTLIRKSLPTPFSFWQFWLKVVGALSTLVLCFGLGIPLAALAWQSLSDDSGNFIGLAHFSRYLTTPDLLQAFFNTLLMGCCVMVLTVVLAFALAYCLTHARVRGDMFCRMAVLVSLFVPTLFPAIGLIFLFGDQGLLRIFLGGQSLYGPVGIILAGVVYTLPHAFLLLYAALSNIEAELYYAARVLGAGAWRRFITVTLPQSRYGLMASALVVFILLVTDFGIPKVLGGDYSMLATEIFVQITGQHDLHMGSAISLILLLPCFFAFALEQWVRKRQVAGGQRLPYVPPSYAFRDWMATCCAWCIGSLPVIVLSLVIWGAFIRFWPYDLQLTLSNFYMHNSVYGLEPLWNSVILAFATAICGSCVIFGGAYVVERCSFPASLKFAYRFLALLPLGIPGVVLGVGFLLSYSNVFGAYTGFVPVMGILVFHCVIHFYTVCHFSCVGSLRRMPAEYEMVGATLGVPGGVTFFRVVVPLQRQALLDMFFYLFVSGLTTISGVVFLYSVDTIPASVAILQMLESGNTAEAAALGTLLFWVALLVRMLQNWYSRRV